MGLQTKNRGVQQKESAVNQPPSWANTYSVGITGAKGFVLVSSLCPAYDVEAFPALWKSMQGLQRKRPVLLLLGGGDEGHLEQGVPQRVFGGKGAGVCVCVGGGVCVCVCV